MTTLTNLPEPTEWDKKHLLECDPSVRVRRLIELAIVRRLFQTLINGGYSLTIDVGDDPLSMASRDINELMPDAFAADICTVYVAQAGHPTSGWVDLVYGNDGWDVISDYSTNLEELLKPVNDYADSLSAWC